MSTETVTEAPAKPRPIHGWVLPRKLPEPIDPALIDHAAKRAAYAQNRVADKITAFAGSMAFVYVHIIWFGCWIGFGVEAYPFGLLTMIVSLEAIFLTTFVMISQNRAEVKHQVVADEQWHMVQEEDQQNKQLITLSNTQKKQNEQLLDLSKQILGLTKEVRGFAGNAEDDSRQRQELLEVSKRTLALTEKLHHAAG